MRDPLSKVTKEIKPSGIRKFFDIVSEMKDAISLGVGEPDFDTLGILEKREYIVLRKDVLFIHLTQVLKS